MLTTPSPDNHVPDDLDARMRRLLERLVGRGDVHHACVTVTGRGHHWAAARGPNDLGSRPDTPFFVASVTKRFIVTLVLQAHERGELDLDTPFTAYLPEVTEVHVLDGVDHTPAITLRHLASHTSGLPDHFEKRREGRSLNEHLMAGRDTGWTFEDTLRTTREQQRPYFPPQDLSAARQKARYSDTGFQLLIRVLERATGRSFGALLTERILGPLDLKDTRPPGPPPPGTSPLHTRQRRVELPALLASSNDLHSTTGDLITFQRALLDGRLLADPRPLTERRNRLRNLPMIHYGLGTMYFNVHRLMTGGRAPLTLVGHAGGTGTWLFHCPELDLHLAGTIDQTKGAAVPFRYLAGFLNAWRSS